MTVRGLGEDLRVTFDFAGELPAKMPDERTAMVVSFTLSGRKKDSAYGFAARADTQGWRMYSGSKGKQTRYPGTFTLDGSRMVMTFPWSYVNGPRAFGWYANSSWFTRVGNAQSYSFDEVPNDGGSFPD